MFLIPILTTLKILVVVELEEITNSNNSNSYGNGSSNSATGNGKRERRGSRLADPSEFGSFHFRNLHVLEKANKDVINRLKNEHLEHRNSFSSSSSSESTTNSRPRGLSFSGMSNNNSPGNPFQETSFSNKLFKS